MEFESSNASDFTDFKPGHVFPHVIMEKMLTKIGGGSTPGTEYKQKVLKLAGWKYDPIIGYAKHAEIAAQTFNRLREIIQITQDKNEILNKLSS